MAKAPHISETLDAAIIASANRWSVFQRRDVFDRQTEEFDTRAEAEAKGQALADQHGRPALIYALNADGRHAFAATIRPTTGPRAR